jgi:hypothetical protein
MKQMKSKQSISQIINVFNQDVYYTCPDWPSKEIDGVEFIAVKMKLKDPFTRWMRKDSFKKVKV